jgi:hypothetical protein
MQSTHTYSFNSYCSHSAKHPNCPHACQHVVELYVDALVSLASQFALHVLVQPRHIGSKRLRTGVAWSVCCDLMVEITASRMENCKYCIYQGSLTTDECQIAKEVDELGPSQG